METWINVTVAVACWLLFEALVAVTDTVCCVDTDGGAVYKPFEETVPKGGATVKLAGVFELNCCTWAAPSVADGGVIIWGAVDKVPYTTNWFENVGTYTFPLATVGAANLAMLPKASRPEFWSLFHNSTDTSAALKAWTVPGTAELPGAELGVVAHTMPDPAVPPFAETLRPVPYGDVPALTEAGVVSNSPPVNR
jgi:hypothetical protein